MSNKPPEPHPLDDDEPQPQPRSAIVDNSVAYQPLLKPSTRILIASFVIVFCAGLAAINAQPNSALETIASVVNRLGMVLMLAAFSAILVAYRIPRMRQSMLAAPKQNRSREPDVYFDTEAWQLDASREYTSRTRANFGTLVGINIAAVVVLLTALTFASMVLGFMTILIVVALQQVFAGVLVTMIVWHKGQIRAYAIGALSALVFSTLVITLSLVTRRALWPLGIFGIFSIAIPVVTPPLAGLISAAYVSVLEHLRK